MSDDLFHPPWEPASDEVSVSDGAGFSGCDAVIRALAEKADSNPRDTQYSLSKQWGKVVRTKLTIAHGGLSATTLVVCWSSPDGKVQMVAQLEDCGAQLSGC